MSTRYDQSAAVRKRALKMTKLLHDARMETESTGDSVAQLASHLCKDYDVYDPLQRILDTLDASLIPLVPVARLKGALLKRVHDAADGLADMAAIFLAVNLSSHKSEALESYKDRAYSMVVQRWAEVTRWMLYLLSFEPSAEPEGMDAAASYVQAALRMICINSRGHAFKEEILSQDKTVNLLFIVLSQKDRMTGRLWDFAPSPSEASVLCEFLHHYCQSEVGRRAVTGRLTAVSKKTRRAVLDAILVRAREAVSNLETKNILGVAASIHFIINAVARLTSDRGICRTCAELDFLARLTQDLCLLVTTAKRAHPAFMSFWSNSTSAVADMVSMAFSCAPHPSRHIAKLVEAGILGCASQCLLLYTTGRDPMADLLRALLPYLYSAKAVLVRHSAPESAGVWGDKAPWSQGALEVWSAWNMGLEDSTIAFVDWKDRPIKTCSNFMCPRDPDQSKPRVCGRCHTTVYCCTACQDEDWRNLHSKECMSLAKEYLAGKLNRSWCSTAMRADYLRLLNYFVNSSLPPASHDTMSLGVDAEKCAGRPSPIPSYVRRDATVWTWDTLHRRDLATKVGIVPLHFFLSEEDVWKCRFQQMVLLVQKDPDVVLVQALFQFNHLRAASIFAAVKYSPNAPEHQRYSTITSIFRFLVWEAAAGIKESRNPDPPLSPATHWSAPLTTTQPPGGKFESR